MSLNADTLIDRSHLKGQIAKWRIIAIVVVVLSVVLLTERFSVIPTSRDYIARISVEGVIADDIYRDKLFTDIMEDDNIKAVILRVDSPGGTVVGGEELYLNVKALAEVKPVVVTMRSLATSAGYMATLSANRIYARQGTITGSIGVIMQTAEVTELAEKMGVNPVVIKSGPNKASPNPLEKMTPENREAISKVVMGFYGTFVDMVAESRNMPRESVLELADGRVFTGPQAMEAGLVDAIGGEEEALAWLQDEKKLDPELEVVDREPKYPRRGGVTHIFEQLAKITSFFPEIQLDGLVSIWQPKPM